MSQDKMREVGPPKSADTANTPGSFWWAILATVIFGYLIATPNTNAQSPCSSGNKLQDPGFEASSDNTGNITNPTWNSSSTVFGTSLCNTAACGDGGGTAGPRNGDYWVWFGGTAGPESGTLSQSVALPAGATATLKYYLRIGAVETPFTDIFRVMVDGTTVQTVSEPSVAEANYQLRQVNLNAYADGQGHTISFQYDSPSGGGTANFNLDDVTLEIACPATSPPSVQLANISTRLVVGTGGDALIGGFIITGTHSKKIIVRAIGPSLGALGVLGALGDPTLELHDGTGALIASNDNWQVTQLGGIITASQVLEIQNSGVSPSAAAESAIIASLPPGAYTAIVRGKNNTTGVGLVEAYDLDRTVDSKLANISTRGFVRSGDNVMIGGLIITGSVSTNVVVRAIGPSLVPLGITNALPDPALELRDSNGQLWNANDNWRSAQQVQIAVSGLPPSNNAEAALVATLAPGAYTAIVRGTNGSTGVALVEAYNLTSDTEYFPPYFTMNGAFGVAPGGQFQISLPDGTVIPDGSDQLVIFLDTNATLVQMQAVAGVLANAHATVVGEIPSLHELQIKMNNPAQAANLIASLQATAGVIATEPNISIAFDQCSANAVQGTAWKTADNLADSPSASNNVVIGLLDGFDMRDAKVSNNYTHGQVTNGFLENAAGPILASQVTPLAVDDLDMLAGTDFRSFVHNVIARATTFVANNPNKKVVLSISLGPTVKTNVAETTLFLRVLKYLSDALRQQFGDRVIVVKSAGNGNFSIPSDARLDSCNLVTVGGLDQSSPTTATPWSSRPDFGTNSGANVTVYAPSCGVSPDSSFVEGGQLLQFDGTSFATPQVAGQLAAIWASNPSLSGCQVASQLRNLHPVNGLRRFDGGQLANLVKAQPTAPPVANIAVSPSVITFSATEGGFSPSPQILTITNNGGAGCTLNFAVSKDASWLGLSGPIIPLAAGDSVTYSVSANIGGLTAANSPYTATIAVSDTGSVAASRRVPVSLTLSPKPSPSPSPTPTATPAPCSSTQVAGGDTAETRTIQMGKTSGTFSFSYDTYSIADRIVVSYEGQTLFDTGCVGASGSVNLSYAGTSSIVTVRVTPNCAGDSGTQWTFTVGCPK